MNAIAWPTAAIVIVMTVVLGALALHDPGVFAVALVGFLGTISAAIAPKLVK